MAPTASPRVLRSAFRAGPVFLLLVCALAQVRVAAAQGTPEDYRRALRLEEAYRGLVSHVAEDFRWNDASSHLTFRRSVTAGDEFLVTETATGEVRRAFDHERLAEGLSSVTGEAYGAFSLPFRAFGYVDDGGAVEVAFGEATYRCDLAGYRCAEVPGAEPSERGGSGGPADGEVGGPRVSPDGRWEGLVENHNVVIRQVGSDSDHYRTHDGSEGNAYRAQTLAWSPDSRGLVAQRVVPRSPHVRARVRARIAVSLLARVGL